MGQASAMRRGRINRCGRSGLKLPAISLGQWQILNRLVDKGNTVIVIEHSLDVISQADWLIDMGPDGWSRGRQIIFETITSD
ncbi:hypothetical protein ACX12E_21105 [Paenibacillus vandeheii]